MEQFSFDADAVQRMLKQRRYPEAMAACEATLASPQAPESHKKSALHLKGMTYYFTNSLSQSIDCFKRVLEMDPRHTDSAITLSVIYNDLGKYDEAKRAYQMANQSLPQKKHGTDAGLDMKFALKHIELGDLYFKYNRFDEALEDYGKALRLAPQQPDYRIKIAKCYAKKGYTTRAIQEIKQISGEHPDYLPARIHLGLMYFSLGNVIDAQTEWEQALQLEPGNQEVLTYLGMAKQATETTS
jgi:tetratricopeptide (TPR) repeat protein